MAETLIADITSVLALMTLMAGIAVTIWRIILHFNRKELCFTLMKNNLEAQGEKVNDLEKRMDDEIKKAHELHVDVFKSIHNIDLVLTRMASQQGLDVVEDLKKETRKR